MPLSELGAFQAAIAKRESGDNYGAVGVDQGSRYGVALGKYQVMSEIMRDWAAAAGYGYVSNEQWLSDPQMQEDVVGRQMTQLYNEYGRWDLVAAAWFGGRGAANAVRDYGLQAVAGRNDGFISVPTYVNDVMGYMEQFSGSTSSVPWGSLPSSDRPGPGQSANFEATIMPEAGLYDPMQPNLPSSISALDYVEEEMAPEDNLKFDLEWWKGGQDLAFDADIGIAGAEPRVVVTPMFVPDDAGETSRDYGPVRSAQTQAAQEAASTAVSGGEGPDGLEYMSDGVTPISLSVVEQAMKGIPGLTITSTYRTPEHEASLAGGSPTSWHLSSKNPAVDVAGPVSSMDQLAERLRGYGYDAELLWQTAGHYDHVHYAIRHDR